MGEGWSISKIRVTHKVAIKISQARDDGFFDQDGGVEVVEAIPFEIYF